MQLKLDQETAMEIDRERERERLILKHNLKLKVPPVSSDISAGYPLPLLAKY